MIDFKFISLQYMKFVFFRFRRTETMDSVMKELMGAMHFWGELDTWEIPQEMSG